jgi:hypothetical protein
MKKIIGGVLLMIAGIVGGLYVGGWVLFIQPIIEACQAFDAGTLTGTIVGITVLKCIFASAVGSIIAYVGFLVGGVLATN